MAETKKVTARVGEVSVLAPGICSMWIEGTGFAQDAVPGQFISVYCEDKSKLLPRPISICEIDAAGGRLRIVYRIAGAGTEELSRRKTGEAVEVMGPLGNGYMINKGVDHVEGEEERGGQAVPCPGKAPDGRTGTGKCSVTGAGGKGHAILIGGGIGIPPLLALAKELPGGKTAVLGYRDNNTFLKEEFEAAGCQVVIATDDGSVGYHGNVIDAIRAQGVQGDMIFSCGPTPMQRGVKAYAKEQGIPAQLSLEERMACGIGACLACVCASARPDAHSHVHNKRVCKDGPVFFAEEIELQG